MLNLHAIECTPLHLARNRTCLVNGGQRGAPPLGVRALTRAVHFRHRIPKPLLPGSRRRVHWACNYPQVVHNLYTIPDDMLVPYSSELRYYCYQIRKGINPIRKRKRALNDALCGNHDGQIFNATREIIYLEWRWSKNGRPRVKKTSWIQRILENLSNFCLRIKGNTFFWKI